MEKQSRKRQRSDTEHLEGTQPMKKHKDHRASIHYARHIKKKFAVKRKYVACRKKTYSNQGYNWKKTDFDRGYDKKKMYSNRVYEGKKKHSNRGRDRMKTNSDRGCDRKKTKFYRDKSYIKGIQYISEGEICEISELEENMMVKNLSMKIKGFQELLDKEDLIKKPAIMNAVLIILEKSIQVIGKAKHGKPNELCEKASKIISEVLNDGRNVFRLKLKIYLQSENWQYFSVEKQKEICSLFCKMLEIFPELSWSVIPVKQLQSEVLEVNPEGDMSNNENLKDIVDKMVLLYEDAKKGSLVHTGRPEQRDLDNSKYKNIPIMPTWTEIIQIRSASKKCLRENVIKGRYDDWLHYFDVHFRLLREDFVAPLQDGVRNFLKGLRGRELNDIKVYTNVRLRYLKCSKSGICFAISLGVVPRSSKRLIHGSLVCLSHDNFNEDVFFATVDSRDGIARGIIDLVFHGVSNADMLQFMSKEFVMVESAAYFEAYRHILHSLQTAEDIAMPFTKYLIDADCSTVNKPQYLNYNFKASYNLTHLLKHRDDEDDMCDQKGKTYSKLRNICDSSLWPQLEDVDLDESQLEALQNGLTQEISVIQGPPGTGKTYIGLKIVESLLKNENSWNSSRIFGCKSPILVMCLTNHALDQFLEGILDCSVYKGAENIPLLRVGSRTKSERLEKLNMRNKLKDLHLPSVIFNQRRLVFQKLECHEKAIEVLWDEFKLSLDTIVPLSYLHDFLDPNHEYFFHYNKQNPHNFFLLWITEYITVHPAHNWHHEHQEAVPNYSCGGPIFQVESNGPSDNGNGYQESDSDDDDRAVIEEVDDDYKDYHCIRHEEIQNSSKNKEFKSIIPGILEKQRRLTDEWKLKQAINYLSTLQPMTKHEAKPLQNLNGLNLTERLRLYKYWMMKYQKDLTHKLDVAFKKYESGCEEIKKVRAKMDRLALETASVIGMTTTGAAKYQHLLQLVKPRIVIVEEAAEVLESHIVSALTADTQHLILIGDHKQLRPKPNVYKLAKTYRLDVSLFERLILNGHSHVTLNIQHRMRPEIAELIHPHIYDNLRNHTSVKEYPNVRGVGTNLFLINHEQMESEVDRECSHSNDHEVDFLVALCKYLLQQDYSTSQITILVTYSGQLLKMKKKISEERITQGVRVSTVDDFQGEENDIILLSFVRSNKENNAGFLKKENRVCVAMSRARQGLYCIGNFQLLRTQTLTWKHIIEDMENKNKIGNQLKLQCHNHPEQTFMASSSEDFVKNSPLGGCPKNCCYRLSCGHVCSRKCHSSDPDHKSYTCTKNCNQKCPEGHPCPLKCYEECEPCKKRVTVTLACEHKKAIECSADPSKVVCKEKCSKQCPMNHPCKKLCYEDCGNCEVEVLKVMEDCNHEVHLPCHIPPLHMNCPKKCDKLLPCNHKCALNCGQECSSGDCLELVQVTLNCEHKSEIPCWKYQRGDYDRVLCSRQCDKLLPCNHQCTNYCSEPCAEKCMEIVDKSFPCNHVKQDHCYKTVCGRACEKKLTCAHPCPNPCGEPCAIQCFKRIKRKYPCGHTMDVACSSTFTNTPCKNVCGQMLACGHRCAGKCHECSSSNVHMTCTFKVELNRFCGHQQTVTCAGLSNVACQKTLEVSCFHGSLYISCMSLTPYLNCQEPCQWQCDHFKCSRLCSEKCNRPPCDKPCYKKLKCGHLCYGLCGETCLRYCPFCEKTKFDYHLQGTFIKTKRYYQLTCGHMFTVQYLDEYVKKIYSKKSASEVGPLICPIESCRIPMSTSFRYSDAVKCSLKRMQDVREKIYSDEDKFMGLRKSLVDPLLKHNSGYFNPFDLSLSEIHSTRSNNEMLFLESLLLRTVNVVNCIDDCTSNIKRELIEQLRMICSSIQSNKKLAYSAVQDMEHKFLRQCLECQVYLAKKNGTSAKRSIKMVETFLSVLTTRNKKIRITKQCFCSKIKQLTNDLPQTMAITYDDVKLQYPILHKGVWWHCKKGHYYCTPASINAVTEHHCPECEDSFFNYVHQPSNNENASEAIPESRKRPFLQDPTPHSQGSTPKRRRLENDRTPRGSHRHYKNATRKQDYYPTQQRQRPMHISPGHHSQFQRKPEWSPISGQRRISPALPKILKHPSGRRNGQGPEVKRGKTDSYEKTNANLLNHTNENLSVFKRLGEKASASPADKPVEDKYSNGFTLPQGPRPKIPKIMKRLGPPPP